MVVYVCMHVCVNVKTRPEVYVCMYICMYVCMYVSAFKTLSLCMCRDNFLNSIDEDDPEADAAEYSSAARSSQSYSRLG